MIIGTCGIKLSCRDALLEWGGDRRRENAVPRHFMTPTLSGVYSLEFHFLKAKDVSRRSSDAAGGRAVRRPEIGMIGHRRVFCVEPLRRGIEQTKSFAGNARH